MKSLVKIGLEKNYYRPKSSKDPFLKNATSNKLPFAQIIRRIYAILLYWHLHNNKGSSILKRSITPILWVCDRVFCHHTFEKKFLWLRLLTLEFDEGFLHTYTYLYLQHWDHNSSIKKMIRVGSLSVDIQRSQET